MKRRPPDSRCSGKPSYAAALCKLLRLGVGSAATAFSYLPGDQANFFAALTGHEGGQGEENG